MDLWYFEQGMEGLEDGGAFVVGAVLGVASPVEADLWERGIAEARQFNTALLRKLGIGLEIRNFMGNGFEGGLEDGGKAQQRAMTGERRLGVTVRDELELKSGQV